jgi:hypothetical protein
MPKVAIKTATLLWSGGKINGRQVSNCRLGWSFNPPVTPPQEEDEVVFGHPSAGSGSPTAESGGIDGSEPA